MKKTYSDIKNVLEKIEKEEKRTVKIKKSLSDSVKMDYLIKNLKNHKNKTKSSTVHIKMYNTK